MKISFSPGDRVRQGGEKAPDTRRHPPVTITRHGNELAFQIAFPPRYAERIGFRLETSPTLDGFAETALTASPHGDTFRLHIPQNPHTPTTFHRFRLFLKTP